MKTNRIRTTQPVIRTREGMESLIGEIAALKNQQRLLTAAMDEQIQFIREQFEPQLAAQNEALDQKMEHARVWAEANPHEFGAARSIETVHGAVGWRTGQPALKTLPGWTFDRVLQTLKTAGAPATFASRKKSTNKTSSPTATSSARKNCGNWACGSSRRRPSSWSQS